MDGTGSAGNYSVDLWEGSDSANGIGYHGLAGAEYLLNPNTSIGIMVKWFKAKLDFEDFSNDKSNIGGTTINLMSKYVF